MNYGDMSDLCSIYKPHPLQKFYANSPLNVVTQLKYANGIMFHLHTKEVTDFAVIQCHDCEIDRVPTCTVWLGSVSQSSF